MTKKSKKLQFFIIFVLIYAFSVIFNQNNLYSRDLVKFELAKAEFSKGLTFFNNMQYLAAVEFFRKAIREYPEYVTARDYLGRSYKLAGFVDEALKEWEILFDLNNENVLIENKIENLRFRDSIKEIAADYSRLVLFNVYNSRNYKQYSFNHPADIAIDSNKNLYITSFSNGELIKIDPNGKGQSTIKNNFTAKLYGVDCFRDKVGVTDFKNDTVFILNENGKILKKFGGPGIKEGQFHGPQGICFDDFSKIYVVDSSNHRVQKFNEMGEFLLSFGSKGEYENQFYNPTDITSNDGKVYVTDTGNKRLAVYDESGNFIENIDLGLEKPRGISSTNSMLLISDEKRGLLFYNLNNKQSNWFNSWGEQEHKFSRLISSITDRDGFIYCLDFNRQSVSIFSNVEKRYSNLEVEINSVDISKFPLIAFYVSIRNKLGKPIFGLNENNFTILENSNLMRGLSANYLKQLTPSVSATICVDRSNDNSGYHNEIPWVADFFLQKMKVVDSVQVLNFNDDAWIENKFDWSRRRTLKALRKRTYGKGKNIGTALYNSISDMVPRLNRRGVIFITNGNVDDESFQKYTVRNIINYARIHYIPIYIVSFKEPHEDLVRIANETGGQLIRPNQVDQLRTIYHRIRSLNEYRYVLVYSSYNLKSLKGLWSDVKIEVNYKNQRGVEYGGYFVP